MRASATTEHARTARCETACGEELDAVMYLTDCFRYACVDLCMQRSRLQVLGQQYDWGFSEHLDPGSVLYVPCCMVILFS